MPAQPRTTRSSTRDSTLHVKLTSSYKKKTPAKKSVMPQSAGRGPSAGRPTSLYNPELLKKQRSLNNNAAYSAGSQRTANSHNFSLAPGPLTASKSLSSGFMDTSLNGPEAMIVDPSPVAEPGLRRSARNSTSDQPGLPGKYPTQNGAVNGGGALLKPRGTQGAMSHSFHSDSQYNGLNNLVSSSIPQKSSKSPSAESLASAASSAGSAGRIMAAAGGMGLNNNIAAPPATAPASSANGMSDSSSAGTAAPTTNSSRSASLTPEEVMKSWSNKLTPYEHEEIYRYPQIWFIGHNAKKRQGTPGGLHNAGYDDENGSYILVPHDHIAYRYEVLKVIGKGSFGQVVKAFDHKLQDYVALKVVRNERRFHRQAQEEIRILDVLRNQDRQHDSAMNIVHMLDHFKFRLV